MNLPDFLQKLNQGGGKAFGENAKSLIDSLLYAKLPPKPKRCVSVVRLENGTYKEIVAYLESDLELNISDNLPMATMASASTSSRYLLANCIDTNEDVQCYCCKANDHFWKNCPKLKKKKDIKDKNGPKTQHQTYPPFATCGKTNHPTNNCGNALELTYVLKGLDKMTKPMTPQVMKEHARRPITQKRQFQTNQFQRSLNQKTNFAMTRQNVKSDPPITKYSRVIQDTNGIPSVVWQQQLEKACIKTYKVVHNDRSDQYYEMDCTKRL